MGSDELFGPIGLMVARGKLSPAVSIFRKFGVNPAVGATEELISQAGAALPNMPTTAQSVEIVSASVTVLGDALADGSGSVAALTASLPAGAIITQEYGPRFITGAGYEMADRMEFLGDTTVTLAALEGVVLFLDYTLATQNPTTDRWIASIEWTES